MQPQRFGATLASRRAVLRALMSAVAVPAVGGCARLAGPTVQLDVPDLSVNPTILVATTRKPAEDGQGERFFGSERASKMSLARAKLTPPPADGNRISLASMTQEDWRLEAVEPVKHLNNLLVDTTGLRDVLIYVHGYNQTFETAAIDAARISDGVRFHGETMVFSWPSKASLFDYGYDRESAMWSRDALDQVLSALIASPNVRRVHVVAHSIGTMLTMETLRQLYARRGAVAARKIGAIIYASPDIDMDVFTSSVKRIGPLARKITVITATNDRALAVASLIAGGVKRVGAAEKEALEKMGLQVVDASQEGWGVLNHDLFLSNPQIWKVIRTAIDAHVADAGAVRRSS